MSNTYKIGTLEDIAAIPEEALPRFLEELPHMLAGLRRTMALRSSLPEGVIIIPAKPIAWTDDGVHEGAIRVTRI
jgi:hypothetical protein